MTKVVNVKVTHIRPEYKNLKEWCESPNNLYIGRKGVVFIDGERYPKTDSKWANPFKVTDSREECIQKYREYITKKINERPDYYDLNELIGKNLGCWCVPDSCHGHVLCEFSSKNL